MRGEMGIMKDAECGEGCGVRGERLQLKCVNREPGERMLLVGLER